MIRHINNIHKNELHWLDDERKAKFSEEHCKVQCRNCDRKFISEESKHFHKARIHGKGKFECEKCNKKFSDTWKFKHHQLICKSGKQSFTQE